MEYDLDYRCVCSKDECFRCSEHCFVLIAISVVFTLYFSFAHYLLDLDITTIFLSWLVLISIFWCKQEYLLYWFSCLICRRVVPVGDCCPYTREYDSDSNDLQVRLTNNYNTATATENSESISTNSTTNVEQV